VSAAVLLAASTAVVSRSGPVAAAQTGSCPAASKVTSSQLRSTVGLTRTSVTVGNISIISGPVPGLFQGAPYGVDAYFAMVNARGGVNGRRLVVSSKDDGFSGTQNQALASQVAASDFAMVGNFSLFDNYGCAVVAANPAMPNVSSSLDPSTNNLPNTFSPTPIVPGTPLAGYEYLKKLYPSAITHVASLVSNVTTSVDQWKGQAAAMESVGYKFPYVRYISPFESSYTTDVVNMRAKGIQMVLLSNSTWGAESALVNEMNRQGFHPTVMMSNGSIYDPRFVKAAGGAVAAKGIWLIQAFSLYLGQDAKKIPAVGTFNSWMAKTHPGFTPDLYSVFGWSSAQLFVQALAAAGKNPTRGSVLAALAKITSFSASGLIGTSNPAKKLPSNCVSFSRIENGAFVRVAPTTKASYTCAAPFYSSAARGTLPRASR